MLNPFIVGKWDGNHVWLQWTPTPEKAYALRLRYWRPGASDWTPWIETHVPWPLSDYYLKVPTHAQGTKVQAQVALFPPGAPPSCPIPANEWEDAKPALFGCCVADFEFAAERKVTFAKGDTFMTMVDADVAAYQLGEDITITPDAPVRARLRSVQKSGHNQLDFADHFRSRPRPGVTLRNLAASENDLDPQPGDGVMIESAPASGPIGIAFGAVNRARP